MITLNPYHRKFFFVNPLDSLCEFFGHPLTKKFAAGPSEEDVCLKSPQTQKGHLCHTLSTQTQRPQGGAGRLQDPEVKKD